MLVILDKDGTLVKPKSGGTFVQSPDDQELLPGVAERIAELKASGHTIVVASNQGGIAAKHKTLEATVAEMQYLMELLPEIRTCYFCPDFEGKICYCVWRDDELGFQSESVRITMSLIRIDSFRKPGAGMLQVATIKHGWFGSNDKVTMIGDRPEDEQAALAANVPFQWADDWRKAKVISNN